MEFIPAFVIRRLVFWNQEDMIELHSTPNNTCRFCTPDLREKHCINGLCDEAKSASDGLPIRCVGGWAYEKIFHLVQYFGIFTNGMKNKWTGLNYIEICSGPGRCILRDSGEEIDGTALAVARHPAFDHVSNAIFIDFDASVIDTLNRRMELLVSEKNRSKIKALRGDFTDPNGIIALLEHLPKSHLNLLFIDPTDCGVPFATIEAIVATLVQVDLIINVADGTDANRNLANAIRHPNWPMRKKYESFLGTESFFHGDQIELLAANNQSADLRRDFLNTYIGQLKNIGLTYSDLSAVKKYYCLAFATKNSRGLDFWRKATAISPHGQRSLGF